MADPGVGAWGRGRGAGAEGWAETRELATLPAAMLIASQSQPCPRGVLQSRGGGGHCHGPPVPILALHALQIWRQLLPGCRSISSTRKGKEEPRPPIAIPCPAPAARPGPPRSLELLSEAQQVPGTLWACFSLAFHRNFPAKTSSSPGEPCKDPYLSEVLVVRRRNARGGWRPGL